MSVTMKWLVFFLVIIKSCTTQNSRSHEKGVSNQQLENWTSEFGRMLYELSCSVTKYKELHNRFQHSNDGIVEKFDLNQMIDEILDEVNTFNSEKITAVKQLSAFAQQKAYEYLDKKSSDGYVETPEETDKKKKYYNAKMVQQMNDSLPNYVKLVDNAHFGEMVNLNLSTVHVPTSIYDQDENILEAIFWSKDLDVAFTSNYKSYPTLSWQYFGSSTGFLRQFPGA
ncbi:unnamed protein product [Allacma fusca]|uniref:VWA N-terminal domain-containing protein n=1 Tax=Allacma fusca TaxID=39272 RepID=A0A8J2JVM8_9HEXA|nr:unnamed protein product [Allacma fusca]